MFLSAGNGSDRHIKSAKPREWKCFRLCHSIMRYPALVSSQAHLASMIRAPSKHLCVPLIINSHSINNLRNGPLQVTRTMIFIMLSLC